MEAASSSALAFPIVLRYVREFLGPSCDAQLRLVAVERSAGDHACGGIENQQLLVNFSGILGVGGAEPASETSSYVKSSTRRAYGRVEVAASSRSPLSLG
jgi:hypothetical protein